MRKKARVSTTIIRPRLIPLTTSHINHLSSRPIPILFVWRENYKRKAARPATAMKPGIAVCIGPAPPLEVEVAVAADAADEAAELPEAATLDALLEAEAPTLDALDPLEESTDETLALEEDAEAAPASVKMVVLPTVLVNVEEPEVITDSRAEVVIAVEEPPDVELADPEDPDPDDPPPAPPMPKIVVLPTVLVKVEEPEVTTDSRAEVVMAEEDPVAVVVTVADGEVTSVVAVVVAADPLEGPVADPEPAAATAEEQ